MPLFSVIIPTHNRARLLEETLGSVFHQHLTDYEILVINDGSTDETAAMLARHGEQLRVFEQQNRGPGAARNLGVRHARGEYIAFLDSDDLWFPWTLEIYERVIKQTQGPAFIAGKPMRFAERQEVESISEEPLAIKSFTDYYASGDEWRWWGVSSFVIRADVLRAAGGFTDIWINGEDADLALRLGVARRFVQVCAPFTFGYREHGTNATKDLRRTLKGVWHKVRSEQDGHYPGGPERRIERLCILTRHVRPVTLDCLREGLRRDAWRLYYATFIWHLALGRARYLLAFPLVAIMSKFRAAEALALRPMQGGE